MVGGSSGAGEIWSLDIEVPEADAHEQLQGADGDDPVIQDVDPEHAVGDLTGRDLDVALTGANEADLAEQSYEVRYEDDDLDR